MDEWVVELGKRKEGKKERDELAIDGYIDR